MKIKIDDIGDEWITDDVGGLHSTGLGWSPDGTFCGECSYIDCSKCRVYTKEKPQHIVKKSDK